MPPLHPIRFAPVLAVLLAGCAFVDPARLPPGSSAADVRARLGPPSAEHALATGTRYEYATGPFGKTTWMLDFDPSGSLRQSQQVLTEAQFNAIRAGMPVQDLRATLGRPSETQRITRQQRTIWSYRYGGPFCQLFQVGVGDDGTVVETGYGPDPLCEMKEPAEPGR